MKSFSLKLLTVVACCGVVTAYAKDKKIGTIQSPKTTIKKQSSELNIGVVDLFGSMSDSDKGKEKQDAVTAMQAKEAAKLEEKRQESTKKLEAFNAKKETLSIEAREKQEQELVTLSRELQNEVQVAQEQIRLEMDKATRELAQDGEKAAIEIAKAEDLDVLLEKNTGRVVWSKDNFDVTKKVTNKMNDQYKVELAQSKNDKANIKTTATKPVSKSKSA